MSALLPPDCDGLVDAPYHLADAISLGLRFLRFEELPIEDQPPKRIWFDTDAMKAHWDQVERNRKARMRGETPEGPSETNAAAEDMLVG